VPRHASTTAHTPYKGDRMRTLRSLRRNQNGATMAEYGLLVAFIALVALVGVQALGLNLNTLFNTVATTI
jgi:pilus assembly protein Flp/PilA